MSQKIENMVNNGFTVMRTATGYMVVENKPKPAKTNDYFSFHNKETFIDFLIENLPQCEHARETTPFSKEFES